MLQILIIAQLILELPLQIRQNAQHVTSKILSLRKIVRSSFWIALQLQWTNTEVHAPLAVMVTIRKLMVGLKGVSLNFLTTAILTSLKLWMSVLLANWDIIWTLTRLASFKILIIAKPIRLILMSVKPAIQVILESPAKMKHQIVSMDRLKSPSPIHVWQPLYRITVLCKTLMGIA